MNSWNAFSYFKKVHGIDQWRDEAEKKYYNDILSRMAPEDIAEGLAEFNAAYRK